MTAKQLKFKQAVKALYTLASPWGVHPRSVSVAAAAVKIAAASGARFAVVTDCALAAAGLTCEVKVAKSYLTQVLLDLGFDLAIQDSQLVVVLEME